MKRIKHILSAIAIFVLAFGNETAKAEFRWGPSAGIDVTTLKYKQNLVTVSKAVGPTLGVQGEMMFPGIGFGIDIAALYSMQGATLDLGRWPIFAGDGFGRERVYMHTLSIPIDLRFKWTRMNGIEDIVAPYVFGGPVFNFNICHNKVDAMKYPFGSIGIQAGLGAEIFKNWQVQGAYVWGMTYATKMEKLIDYSARERYWTIRVTYVF